jgi:hypothetical protein
MMGVTSTRTNNDQLFHRGQPRPKQTAIIRLFTDPPPLSHTRIRPNKFSFALPPPRGFPKSQTRRPPAARSEPRRCGTLEGADAKTRHRRPAARVRGGSDRSRHWRSHAARNAGTEKRRETQAVLTRSAAGGSCPALPCPGSGACWSSPRWKPDTATGRRPMTSARAYATPR